MGAEVHLTTKQRVKVAIIPRTPTSGAAPINGTPEWSALSGGVTAEPQGEGVVEAYITSGEDIGEHYVKVAFKADLNDGEGERDFEDLIKVVVENENADYLGYTFSAPEPKDDDEENESDDTEGGEAPTAERRRGGATQRARARKHRAR